MACPTLPSMLTLWPGGRRMLLPMLRSTLKLLAWMMAGGLGWAGVGWGWGGRVPCEHLGHLSWTMGWARLCLMQRGSLAGTAMPLWMPLARRELHGRCPCLTRAARCPLQARGPARRRCSGG